ncbi:hypothetical protein BGZ80_005315, partial [Entomortierella chlamydospora]
MARAQVIEASDGTDSYIPHLHPDSGLILKNAGEPLDTMSLENAQILDDLVGIIITGSSNKSYCAGL